MDLLELAQHVRKLERQLEAVAVGLENAAAANRWLAPSSCLNTDGCNGFYYPSKLKCNKCDAPEISMPKPAGVVKFVPWKDREENHGA